MTTDRAARVAPERGEGLFRRVVAGLRGRGGPSPGGAKRRGPASALGAVVFYVAWAINPALFAGCSQGFSFGEADLVNLVGSTSRAEPYRFSTSDGRRFELWLELKQVRGEDKISTGPRGLPSLVAPAHACGDRTFYRSASACLDTTRLPVEGTMTIKSVGPGPATLFDRADVDGELMVEGTRLNNGELMLRDNRNSVHLRSSDGKSFAVSRVRLALVGEEGGKVVEYDGG